MKGIRLYLMWGVRDAEAVVEASDDLPLQRAVAADLYNRHLSPAPSRFHR
jgi:hypothetical protein